MKKEIPQGAVIGAIGLVVVIVAAWFFLGTQAPTGKVDLQEVDLKDEEPLKPGQPGYRERTTDPPANP